MTKPIFSIIYHQYRLSHNLSMNEYVICDIIYHLSNNKNSTVSGWCFASKQHLGDMIGLSKRAIIDMLKRLLEADFLEINETNTQLLRTTKKWDEVYLTKNLQFGEETSQIMQKRLENKLTNDLQNGEETSPTMQNLHLPEQNLHQDSNLDTENDSAEFAQSVKKLHKIGEETSPYIYSYKDIKSNVYNSLKEKENFEKKSEKFFLNGKWHFLSILNGSQKFNEMRVHLKEFDNMIFSTRCLEEVSISEYSDENNMIFAEKFINDSILKIGCDQIRTKEQMEVLSKSIVKSIVSTQICINWSEMTLATEIAMRGLNHPCFDEIEEFSNPTGAYNLQYFIKVLKMYIVFRNNLDRMISNIASGLVPYKIGF